MERKAIYSPEEKLQIVLSVLHGETTQTEISRRLQMSQTTIAKWRRQFLDGDAQGLGRGDRPKRPANRREEELEEKVEDLASALGEAYVELRVWRKGGSLPAFEAIEALRHGCRWRGLCAASVSPREATHSARSCASFASYQTYWSMGGTVRPRLMAPASRQVPSALHRGGEGSHLRRPWARSP